MIRSGVMVSLLAFPLFLVACKEAPGPTPPTSPSTPSATPSTAPSAAPAPEGATATYEPCPPTWISGSVHTLRQYQHRSITELPAGLPKDGHFDTEGDVVAVSNCPPCPPKAICKPCPEAYVDLKDGNAAAPLRVLTPPGVDFVTGKRFKVSVAACAGTTPQTFQLRGYEPAK